MACYDGSTMLRSGFWSPLSNVLCTMHDTVATCLAVYPATLIHCSLGLDDARRGETLDIINELWNEKRHANAWSPIISPFLHQHFSKWQAHVPCLPFIFLPSCTSPYPLAHPPALMLMWQGHFPVLILM